MDCPPDVIIAQEEGRSKEEKKTSCDWVGVLCPTSLCP